MVFFRRLGSCLRPLLFAVVLTTTLLGYPSVADTTAADTSTADSITADSITTDGRVVHQCFPLQRLPFEAPEIRYTPIVLLLDHHTGTVLYEHDADRRHVPASLTKIVTIYTALEASRDGDFPLDVPVPVDPRSYAEAMPPGSSLMFLGPGQRVDGWDLLRGLAVSSGNDAAVEVALRISGSVSSFAGAMNSAARELGLTGMYFEEPAGLSPGNRITAGEMARMTRAMIDRWPETLPGLFARREFTHPQAHHFEGSIMNGTSIRQSNRNALLTTYPGADGMKTGYTAAAGYNLVATAEREGERLIAVLLGVDATNHHEGNRRRSLDAATLLDWGFENFRTFEPAVPELERVVVRAGRERTVALRVDEPGRLTIPEVAAGSLRGEVQVPEEVWAPVKSGEVVGVVRYVSDGCVVLELPVRVRESIEQGNIFWRLWERTRWWINQVVHRITERLTLS